MGNETIIEVDDSMGAVGDLLARCYRKNPAKEDIQALKKALAKAAPEAFTYVFDLADITQKQTIKGIVGDEQATVLLLEAHVRGLKAEMGYERAPMLEKLLIENIALAWLRYQYAEYQITTRMQGESTYKNLEHWEKRTSAAHRRFTRAIETLARVRKLTAHIQINIAADGGQQVNVNGDLNKI